MNCKGRGKIASVTRPFDKLTVKRDTRNDVLVYFLNTPEDPGSSRSMWAEIRQNMDVG
jgi:hypothetical protein